MSHEKRPIEFYVLAVFFAIFVLFLYGPLSAILILSFQGENGGLTFPMNGVSLHWFRISSRTRRSATSAAPSPARSSSA